MKINILLGLFIIFFGCTNDRDKESFLAKFKTENNFTYKSDRDYSKYSNDSIDSVTINQYFSNTVITQNTRNNSDEFTFKIRPIFKTTNRNNTFLILAKEIALIQVKLTEYYIVKLNEGEIKSIKEIGHHKANGPYITNFELEANNNKLKAVSREVYSRYIDLKTKVHSLVKTNSTTINLDDQFEDKTDNIERYLNGRIRTITKKGKNNEFISSVLYDKNGIKLTESSPNNKSKIFGYYYDTTLNYVEYITINDGDMRFNITDSAIVYSFRPHKLKAKYYQKDTTFIFNEYADGKIVNVTIESRESLYGKVLPKINDSTIKGYKVDAWLEE